MNYYQLLRMVYEQTLQASAASSINKLITSTPEQPPPAQQPVKSRADHIPFFDLTSSQSPPKPIAAISPNMERRSFLGATKTTPPKKRFVNFPMPTEGRATTGKCDLNNVFEGAVKTSEQVMIRGEKEPEDCALVCLDLNEGNAGALATSNRVEDSYGVLNAVKVSRKMFINIKITWLNKNPILNNDLSSSLLKEINWIIGRVWSNWANSLLQNVKLKVENSK